MTILLQPETGLRTDPKYGGQIPLTGCSEDNFNVLRSAAVLTTSFVAGTVLDIRLVSNIALFLDFTLGLLTSLNIKLEFSDNNETDYYQDSSEGAVGPSISVVNSVYNINATGKYIIRVPNPGAGKLKVSAQGVGTVTNSSLAIKALRGWTP